MAVPIHKLQDMHNSFKRKQKLLQNFCQQTTPAFSILCHVLESVRWLNYAKVTRKRVISAWFHFGHESTLALVHFIEKAGVALPDSSSPLLMLLLSSFLWWELGASLHGPGEWSGADPARLHVHRPPPTPCVLKQPECLSIYIYCLNPVKRTFGQVRRGIAPRKGKNIKQDRKG